MNSTLNKSDGDSYHKFDVQTPFNSGARNLHKNVLCISSMSATNRVEKRLRVKAARGKPPYYEEYKISSPVMVTALRE